MRPWHRTALVRTPQVPLYLLGWDRLHGLGSGPQDLAVASQAAGKLTTSLLTSSTTAGGGGATGIAAFAGPIGVGVAVIGSVIAGLWAAHAARAKGAKNENAAVNSAVQSFDSSIRAVFDAANSNDPNKYIDAQTAVQVLQQVLAAYWAAPGIATSGQQPGTSDESGHGLNCATVRAKSTPCDKKCTAACCVGCLDLEPSILDAVAVFQQGGGSVSVRKVYPSKYGVTERPAYTLTYKPNPPVIAEDVTSSLSHIFGGSGSPSGGGSSFLLPALVIGGLALAFS